MKKSISSYIKKIANEVELNEKIRKLEKENTEIHDSFMYKLNHERGEVRGIFQRLQRLLGEALDASKDLNQEQFITKVIKERIEIALDTFKKYLEKK